MNLISSSLQRFGGFIFCVLLTASCSTLKAGQEPPIGIGSPESAAAYCKMIFEGVLRRDGGDPFLSKLQNRSLYTEQELVETFSMSRDAKDSTYWLVQFGDYQLLKDLWPTISQILERQNHDFEWDVIAQAVMCSNADTARFLLETGINPNISRPRTSDLMATAVMNNDIEMARLLFEFGYDKCNYVSGNGKSLITIAKEMKFDEFEGVYKEFCPASEK